jgi:hypothetical protein
MTNTGDARLDHEGYIIPSGEYVAALYESFVSEQEWNDGETYLTRPAVTPVATFFAIKSNDYTMADYGQSLTSLGRYCTAAEVATEDLWTRDLEEFESARDHAYDRWVYENWSG